MDTVWGELGAGRSCAGACGRECVGKGGGRGVLGQFCHRGRTGVRQRVEGLHGVCWGANKTQSPGERRWGPGCTRDTHRHAVALLPDEDHTCY